MRRRDLRKGGRSLGLLAVAVAVPLVFVTIRPVSAAVLGDTTISGPSPFAGCSNAGLPGNVGNAEVEPWVVVNPLNPSNVVAAWQQDRWGDPYEGGAHGLLAWSSSDGGTTGASSSAPFTTCSGGTAANNGNYDRASDVWLSYGPDGAVYQSALVFDEFTSRNGIAVSKSTDGGTTWGNPVMIDRQNQKSFIHGDDKESITADPYRPGYVYAVWDRYSNQNPIYTDGHGQNANKGPAYFSRSTNGGSTWSVATPIYAKNNGTLANQIVVLPNGTLLDYFTEYIAKNVKGGVAWSTRLSELRSTDQGAHWSLHPIVVSAMTALGAFDPNTFAYIRGGDGLFDVAVDPGSGGLYAVWQDRRFNGIDQVAFSKSTNGGFTWSTPVEVNRTPPNADPYDEQAFTPSVDVSSNGTVAVTYYDFRNNTGGPGTPTDYWAVTSSDGGTTWGSETRLTATSFNAQMAPEANGVMIGDYEGLTHSGSTFIAAFEVANDDPGNPTDINLARFTP